jgi:8-hydroxy-5-deazaflavin:NADPH oxidoreductase
VEREYGGSPGVLSGMRIGVLGTGAVGRTIASRLVGLGHEVCLGARDASNEVAGEWVDEVGVRASRGTFADAASFGELVFNCTAGGVSVQALEQAGEEPLRGKVLVDVSNSLDFSQGRPPFLSVVNTDSVGEQIQRRFPETRVVKALNTMNNKVMVDPGSVPGEHHVFVCGGDEAAKDDVRSLLESFGWASERIVDLGGIESARGTEAYVILWLRLVGALGTSQLNIGILR